MADQNTSLPVRTEAAGDVIVKIADASIPAQQLTVNPDGSINVNVAEPVTVDATDFDIRDLTFATDSVDVSGSAVSITGSVVVTATDLDIRNLVFATDKVDVSGSSVTVSGTVTVVATDLDIRDLAFATDKVDVSGSTVDVTATDLDIRDLDAAQDSVEAWIKDATGNAFSPSNPLPVVMVSDLPGDEINDPNTATVAGAGSNNHDYTVTALKTLLLHQIEASASGKIKLQVQIETAVASGTFITRFVKFNSTANPNISIILKSPITVAAGVRVRVVRSNLENQAQDVYSTISGQEV
jgi:hypothetical protein